MIENTAREPACSYRWCVRDVVHGIGHEYYPLARSPVSSTRKLLIQPLEFFYITRIAPSHMAGAYYSSQNLTYLGAASTPVVCGFILARFNRLYFLLYLLGLLLVGGTIFYVEGGKLAREHPVKTKQPRLSAAAGDQGSV